MGRGERRDRPWTAHRSPGPFDTNSNPRPRPGTSSFLEEFAAPAYEALLRFTADLDRLTLERRRTFRPVVTRAFLPGLRAASARAFAQARPVRTGRPPPSTPVLHGPVPMRHSGSVAASSKP